MDSVDEITEMFHVESKKLATLIKTITKSDLTIHEIVETYYQIINVSSMITMIKQLGEKHRELLSAISETEALISKEFNPKIHPQIMQQLSDSIQETTKRLQTIGTGQKSKEQIENDAKFYEDLREKISTKEFVEQYDKGL